MGEYDLHSLILACDFRVDDIDRMWQWLKKHRDGLASIGAHHVVLYTSIWEPRRVLVTIGIRHSRSIREVLRSPAIFEWFDISGAEDIPPIFGGEVVEKIDLYGPSSEEHVGRDSGGRHVLGRRRVGPDGQGARRARPVQARRGPQDLGVPGARRRTGSDDPAGDRRRAQRPAMDRPSRTAAAEWMSHGGSAPTPHSSSASSPI